MWFLFLALFFSVRPATRGLHPAHRVFLPSICVLRFLRPTEWCRPIRGSIPPPHLDDPGFQRHAAGSPFSIFMPSESLPASKKSRCPWPKRPAIPKQPRSALARTQQQWGDPYPPCDSHRGYASPRPLEPHALLGPAGVTRRRYRCGRRCAVRFLRRSSPDPSPFSRLCSVSPAATLRPGGF